MKILFILGSVEPGKDGVGDYTRSLGACLVAMGHRVEMIATHDRSVKRIKCERQVQRETFLSCVRIPQGLNDNTRIKYLTGEIKEFKPDLISLQYVPHSFHRKGVPFFFVNRLVRLLCDYRVHVMFHEVCVGITEGSPVKDRLIGWLQRLIVRRLVSGLRDPVLCTSNRLYQYVLQLEGIQTTILPLFSNIDKVVLAGFDSKSNPRLERIMMEDLSPYLVAGIFGRIYPDLDLYTEGELLIRRAAISGQKPLLVTFGRAGEEGEARLNEFSTAFKGRLEVLQLGELKPDEVSVVLQHIELSLSCTPRQRLGKSGVFAAMRLHGVEVISRDDPALSKYNAYLGSETEDLYRRLPTSWSVDAVAKIFMATLAVKQYR